MAASAASICIFCFGNGARGDDGLGEALFALLQQDRQQQPVLFTDVELVLDFQLAPEHIFDLHRASVGIFVDAQSEADSGVQWERVEKGSQLHFSSHHLPPESLLFLYEETFQVPAPPCYLLSMGAASFELGAPLTPTAVNNLQQAHQLLLQKLAALRQSG